MISNQPYNRLHKPFLVVVRDQRTRKIGNLQHSHPVAHFLRTHFVQRIEDLGENFRLRARRQHAHTIHAGFDNVPAALGDRVGQVGMGLRVHDKMRDERDGTLDGSDFG